MGIVIDDDGVPAGGVADGVGDGDGEVEEVEEPPHPTAKSKTADTTARRKENIRPSDVPNLGAFSNIPDEWTGENPQEWCVKRVRPRCVRGSSKRCRCP